MGKRELFKALLIKAKEIGIAPSPLQFKVEIIEVTITEGKVKIKPDEMEIFYFANYPGPAVKDTYRLNSEEYSVLKDSFFHPAL